MISRLGSFILFRLESKAKEFFVASKLALSGRFTTTIPRTEECSAILKFSTKSVVSSNAGMTIDWLKDCLGTFNSSASSSAYLSRYLVIALLICNA